MCLTRSCSYNNADCTCTALLPPIKHFRTGKYNSTARFPNIDGNVNSTYLVNSGRNLCSRNDYQNLGVNGACCVLRAAICSQQNSVLRSIGINDLSTLFTLWPSTLFSSSFLFLNFFISFFFLVVWALQRWGKLLMAHNCIFFSFLVRCCVGARAGPMNTSIQDGLSRTQDSDEPAIVMYALIGNDVCNGHANDTVYECRFLFSLSFSFFLLLFFLCYFF